METLTKEAAESLTPAVNALLMAKTYAELKREEIESIQLQILKDDVYKGSDIGNRGESRGNFRITETKDTYLMKDEDWEIYHAKVNAINLENGFKDAERGLCPALVAETTVRDAQKILIECAEEYFEGVTGHKLLCAGYGKYQEYIDLLVGLVLSLPDYKNPLEVSA